MVNSRQIVAARALLDWTQSDLASRIGVAKSSIAYVESGKGKASEALTSVLEQNGVEFIDKGVKLSQDFSYFIEGEDWYLDLLDDAYTTLIDAPDSEILFLFSDDRQSPEEVNNRIRKMRNAGIKMRQIVENGNTHLMGPISEYRYMPRQYFTNTVSLVYGDKVAQCIDNNTRAIVHNDSSMAATWRNFFNALFNEYLDPALESTAEQRF